MSTQLSVARTMKRLISILALAMLLAACSKVPSGVIAPEEMALLMADLNTGEAVIDMNRSSYTGDSARQAFKQSIYMKHGVTSAEVDSSFSWYGRNITVYMDVCDRTIEILEQRLIEIGSRVAAEAAMSVAGDSVDVWGGPRFMRIYDRLPSRTLTFDFSRDENWERGDGYFWRVKFFNSHAKARWQMTAEYADGNVEYINRDIEGDGWQELKLMTDSTGDATRIYGALTIENRPGTTVTFDSMEVVRKRLNPATYSQRYMQKTLRRLYPEVEIDTVRTPVAEETDSISTSEP